jgi:glycosyltransferase involved in cell wall biosynthesis
VSGVLLVDWLGRGGIAQTSESWAIVLGAAGHDVTVVTRPDRELGSGAVVVTAAPDARGRVRAHRAVARAAARAIRDLRPSTVVVQNYVLPPLESPVYSAARAVGARVGVGGHAHRLHTLAAGTRVGMKQRVRSADVVVTHTQFVADGVRAFTGRTDVAVVPHPAQVGMLRHDREDLVLPDGPDHWAGHFGVLQRAYKGGDVVEALARSSASGWRVLAVGVGARDDVSGIHAIPGYASPGKLVGAISATDVTLAPYAHATQSGVVVLGHLVGSVPVASAVGGIPEQIEHEVDGLLVPAGAPIDAWTNALATLADDEFRKELAVAGTARAWRDHERFAARIPEIVA